MKFFIKTLSFLILASTARSATLSCSLTENEVRVDSFSESISVNGKPETFKFNKTLNGKLYGTAVNWDTKVATIEIKYKGSPISFSNSTFWEVQKPFGFFFQEKLGDAVVRCEIDVKDGFSDRWTLFYELLKDDVEVVVYTLNLINRISLEPEENIGQTISKNKRICYLISTFPSGSTLHNIKLKLVQLESNWFSSSVFPEAGEFQSKLASNFYELSSYCKSEEFINFVELRSDLKESEDLVSSVSNYLNSKFPNNGTFP